MIYKIIVDKQPRANPSSEKRTYTIDVEELRYLGDVKDTLVIGKGEDYIIRRLEISPFFVLKQLETPIKEPLKDIDIELFEGENYIYVENVSNSLLIAEYIIKNDFTDTYVTEAQMSSAIELSSGQIEILVNQKLQGYSTKEEMNSAISIKADEITNSVSKTYTTKVETATTKQEAINSANSSTDGKLKNYSTTVQMNAAIKLTADEINSEVAKKVNETEFGTKITQNAESVKTAWNNIDEYIQLENINGLASLSIYDDNGKLMALNKNGQNFYKNGSKFGSMGVMKSKDSDTNNYGLAFVLDGVTSGNNIVPGNNFMGFCYKTKNSSGAELIVPFFYLGKINNSQVAGIHMLSDVFFEGNSIIADEFYIKDSLGNILFQMDKLMGYPNIMLNGVLQYNGSTINNIINTYSHADGANAIANMFVGNDNPMWLHATDINGNGGYWIGDDSDRKLKTNIKDTKVNALETISKIKHRQFKWKNNNREQSIGYIAQELEEINKDLIYKLPIDLENKEEKDENYSYQVNNVALNALSTKAIQELYEIVQKQQEQINRLNKEIEMLRRGK